jgi:ABC-type sulfate transport system substrate-binding protein
MVKLAENVPEIRKIELTEEEERKLLAVKNGMVWTREIYDEARKSYHLYIKWLSQTYTDSSIARALGLSRQRVRRIIDGLD